MKKGMGRRSLCKSVEKIKLLCYNRKKGLHNFLQ